MRISEWHEGGERKYVGYIKLFDKPRNQWIEGYYNEGQIMRLFPMRRMTGYWKEMDENNNLIHISNIDKQGKHSGICYNFENDVLKGISHWEEGIERAFNGFFIIMMKNKVNGLKDIVKMEGFLKLFVYPR